MTTFSVTEHGSFKSCRRSWFHGSLNGLALTPWMPNKNLLLGTLIHAVLADWSKIWATGREAQADLDYPTHRFDELWEECKNDLHRRYILKNNPALRPYFDPDTARASGIDLSNLAVVRAVASRLAGGGSVPLGMSDQELDTMYDFKGENLPTLGRAMLENYVERYQEPYPSTYTLIEVEQTVTVPIKGTRHKLEGTFDMVLQDYHGRIIVPDHKTFERRPSASELQQNDQFLRYQWLAQQVWGDKGEVVGTMYNGLWKRVAAPRGRSDSDLFYREIILHDEEELQEIARYLPHEVREMDRVRKNPELQFPNRSWSTCPNCGVQDICQAMSRGELDLEDFREDLTNRERTPAWRTDAFAGDRS